MLVSAADNIIFFAASLSLLTSVGQLFMRERREENENLFFLFFVLGAILIQSHSIITGIMYEYPALFFLNMTFMSLLGPILFRAYYYVIFPVTSFRFRHSLIFIPSLAVLAVDLHYLFLPGMEKVAILRHVLQGSPTVASRVYQFTYLVSLLEAALLHVYLLTVLISEVRDNRYGRILIIDITYTVLSLATFSLACIGILLGSVPLIRAGSLMAATLLIGAYLVGFRFPQFLHLFFVSAMTGKRNRTLTSGIEIDRVLEQLMKTMEEEKLYREEDISLQYLADELSITPHQLSHIINESFNMNFNNFINRFRVDEVRHHLLATPRRSILSIAHEVGFNSKSAFYAAFTHFTGKTPTQFRREKQSGRLN